MIDTPNEARIAAALAKACKAFWTTFAAGFPEVDTGDLDALTTVRFDDALEPAVHEWLRLNWAERATV